jgi:hypothetical protein
MGKPYLRRDAAGCCFADELDVAENRVLDQLVLGELVAVQASAVVDSST